jgi:hypothetical protein
LRDLVSIGDAKITLRFSLRQFDQAGAGLEAVRKVFPFRV